MRNAPFLALLLVFTLHANAQSLKDTIVKATIVGIQYSFQFPFADMANRFGANSSIGATLAFKTKKNFQWGFEGSAMIGDRIRENNILGNLVDENGNITGTDGGVLTYGFRERGFVIKATFGKIIAFKRPNVNSGILLTGGIGFMQHKIKIDIDDGLVPQLNADYRKGYDRMSSGVVLSQFVGYQYISTKRRFSFNIGLEVLEGFLRGQRSWNFATNSADDAKRLDILIGPKVSWILPLYKQYGQVYY